MKATAMVVTPVITAETTGAGNFKFPRDLGLVRSLTAATLITLSLLIQIVASAGRIRMATELRGPAAMRFK
jgi:hypothetical protein